jgi:hypothetical protein
MVVTIVKPEYLPNFRYFSRLFSSDVCIFLDTIPLPKRDVISRALVPGGDSAEWLIVPVKRSNRQGQLIKDAEIDYTIHWERKHLRRLYHQYRKLQYFDETFPLIKDIFKAQKKFLVDMNSDLITAIARLLQISCVFRRGSEFSIDMNTPERKPLLAAAAGAAVYYADENERSYIDESAYKKYFIDVNYSNFSMPKQCFNGGVDVSIVDLLFTCGAMQVNSFFCRKRLEIKTASNNSILT